MREVLRLCKIPIEHPWSFFQWLEQYLRSTVVFLVSSSPIPPLPAPATIKASLVTLHTPVVVLYVFGLCKEYGCHCRGEEDSAIGWPAPEREAAMYSEEWQCSLLQQ